MKCNETIGKWCKNKHGASKIIDTLETYHLVTPVPAESAPLPMLACCHGSNPSVPASPTTFTPRPVHRPRSYLEALHTPATPPLPFTPKRSPLLSLSGCFCCLSPRHFVRECRDPIRYRGCRCSGHRVRKCTMLPPAPPSCHPASPPPAAQLPPLAAPSPGQPRPGPLGRPQSIHTPRCPSPSLHPSTPPRPFAPPVPGRLAPL
jgi:hypothetical protein